MMTLMMIRTLVGHEAGQLPARRLPAAATWDCKGAGMQASSASQKAAPLSPKPAAHADATPASSGEDEATRGPPCTPEERPDSKLHQAWGDAHPAHEKLTASTILRSSPAAGSNQKTSFVSSALLQGSVWSQRCIKEKSARTIGRHMRVKRCHL
ncbi:unnamed protein product [Prorocentrum cordatum]|uniref:Uncharacterized protein n=1 Tax=Prorocentrum cordatum TaxID=2364126 RepID=A0ABN9R152_9DINO|nr:unnamed protein product [Polarella glacialis]